MGFWQSLLGRGESAPASEAEAAQERGDLLPPELVLGIDRAFVYERGERDPEEGARFYIRLPTVGEFQWLGEDDAKARLARTWPELSPVARRRAASLIRTKVVHEQRELAKALRRERTARDFDPPQGPFGWL